MHPDTFKKVCRRLEFVFQQSIHETTLTEEYTGELDISAAVEKEKACWISESMVKVDTPKSILLTTWYFDYISDIERESVIQFFFQLLRRGYPLAISSANGIQAIHGIETLRQQLLDFAPVGATEELQRIDMAIIDAGKLKLLIHELRQGYQKLDNSHIFLPPGLTERDLQKLESNLGPHDTLALDMISITGEKLGNFPVLCDRIYALRGSLPVKSQLNTLNPLQSFKHLEQLFFKNLIFSIEFFVEIMNLPGLKKLDMEQCAISSSPDTRSAWEAMHNVALTRLVMRDVYLEPHWLFDLINKNPGLQHLTLERPFWYPGQEFTIPPGHLQQLEELNIGDGNMPWHQQYVLILAAPNAKFIRPMIEDSVDKQARLEQQAADTPWPGTKRQRGQQSESGPVLSTALANDDLEQTVSRFSPSPPLYSSGSRPRKRLTRSEESSSSDQELSDDRSVETYENHSGISWPTRQLTAVDLSRWVLDGQGLGDVLSIFSLTHLDLSYSNNTNEALLGNAQRRLPNLSSCAVNFTDISPDGLQALFNMCPNLDTLSIRKCDLWSREGHGAFRFSGTRGALRHFDAFHSSLNTQQLLSILQAEPNVVSLNLSYCRGLNLQDVPLKPGQLPYLEELNLSGLELSGDSLKVFWAAAPGLVTLKLFSCSGHLSSPLPPGVLMYLDVECSKFAEQDIQTICEASPLLRFLNISGCGFDDGLLNPGMLPFNQLEVLIAEDMLISSAQFSNLLQTTSSVQKILLEEYYRVASPEVETIPAFSGLKELSIADIRVDCKSYIWGILTNASKLEILMLASKRLFDSPPVAVLKPGSLRHLHSIKIKYFITSDELEDLVLAAPNLTDIELTSIVFDAGDFDLQAGDLQQLRHLLLTKCSIGFEQLRSIIRSAPNLQSVSIDKSYNLTREEAERIENEYPHIKWILNIADSSRYMPALPAAPSRPFSSSRSQAPPVYSLASTELSASTRRRRHRHRHRHHSRSLPGAKDGMQADGNLKNDPQLRITARNLFAGNPGARKVSASKYHLATYCWDAEKQMFVLYQPSERNLRPVTPQVLSLAEVPQTLAQYDAEHYRVQEERPWLYASIWYQVPASSPRDSLTHIACSIPIQDLDVQYDMESGYHFFQVKSAQHRSVLFRYIIQSGLNQEVPQIAPYNINAMIGQLRFGSNGRLEQNDAWRAFKGLGINQQIAALTRFCHFSISSGEDFDGPSWQLFNHLLAHRTGACRHRGQLFTVLASEFGLSAYYEDNECHAFVIARDENNSLHCINLGGAPRSVEELPMDETILDEYADPQLDLDPLPLREHITAPDPSNRYQTWNNRPVQSDDPLSLFNELIQRSHSLPLQLLICEDVDSIEALHQASVQDVRLLFSRHLNDISLSSNCILDGQFYKSDSPVAEFITDAENNPASVYTWFINWSDAAAKHKGLNSLVANTRRLQGRDLPNNLRLVVLMDRATLANMPEGFKRNLPWRSMLPRLRPIPRPVSDRRISEGDILIVDPADWKKILLGQVSAQGQQHEVIQGGLLADARTIHIQNAPQDNREFRMFLNDLEKAERFYFNGEWHDLLADSRIELHNPVIDFPPALRFKCHKQGFLAINQSNYKSFFERTRIDESGIHAWPGLLEAHRRQAVHLTVTQDLSELQCLELVQKAGDWGINVILEPLPQVKLPEAMAEYIGNRREMRISPPVAVYVSNDLDYAAARLGPIQTVPIGLDTRFETLFIDVKRDEQDQFTGQDTDLLRALKRGEDIVLKGKFSKTLVHKLQSLFTRGRTLQVNGEEIPIKGKLILLSDDEHLFAGVGYKRRDYDPKKSFARLTEAARLRLQACYQRLNISPCFNHFHDRPADAAAQMAWVDDLEKRLHLAAGVPLPEAASSSSKLPAATTAAELIAQLRHRPFVFLISSSGAGKSHLMQRSVPAYDPNITVYNGLAELEKWLNHKDGIAYLFIDEANISTQDYLIFDSLMRGESVIWLNGKRYEIPPTHKIVFAGNPYAYGGRMQPDLFRRSPDYMEFKAQPLRRMLQPLLELFEDQDEAFEMIDRCYHQALEAGVTITPRNAFMICQRVFEMKPSLFPERLLLQQAILTELKGLRAEPSSIKPLRRQLKADPLWTAEGKALQSELRKRLPEFADKDYHWTPSRCKIAVAVLAFLAIRQQRMDAPEDKRQGINGFMLEGRGLGKGLLLRNLLQASGTPYVTVSLDNPGQAREQLVQAYREGKLVFIPKFSSDADERLLNDLLSELDPKKNPGFGIIAVHDGGPLSKALSNRFTCMNLKEDSIEDLQQIVRNRLNPPEALLDEHVREYERASRWGKQAGLSSLPGPHTLFEEVRKEMEPGDEAGPSLDMS